MELDEAIEEVRRRMRAWLSSPEGSRAGFRLQYERVRAEVLRLWEAQSPSNNLRAMESARESLFTSRA